MMLNLSNLQKIFIEACFYLNNMGVLSWLGSTFLPSKEVSDIRRMETFGSTHSIYPILAAGVAAATVAIPPLRGLVSTTFIKHPVATLGGGLVASAGGLRLIKPAITTTREATKVAVPVLLGEKPLLPENVKSVAKTIGIIAGAGAIGAGAGIIAEKVMEARKEHITPTSETEGLEKEKALGKEGQPIIAETTTITSGKRHRRLKVKEKPSIRQNVQVMIQNRASASGLRINKKYLNKEVYT